MILFVLAVFIIIIIIIIVLCLLNWSVSKNGWQSDRITIVEAQNFL